MIRLSRSLFFRIAGFLAFITALGAFVVNVYPDQIVCAYAETRRWMKAALAVEPLPARRSEESEFAPCRANAPSTPTGSVDQYFPTGVLGCTDSHERLLTEWYSRQLKALREPSLWGLSRGQQRAATYRFLWLRSFDQPVSIRVTVNPDWTGVLATKVGSGTGGNDPGRVVHDEACRVGKHGIGLLLTRVLETHFWDLPSRGTPGGTDGAEWIIEGVENGRYHIVQRWSPGVGDPVHTLGMTFVSDLARLEIARDRVY